jgi:hypothetical protein
VAVLRDAAIPTGPAQFGVIQAVAPSLGVEVNPVNVRDAGEIERAVAAFARTSNDGLIVTGGGLRLATLHSIISSATGSTTIGNTIGTVRVACSNGPTVEAPWARMTSGASATNSERAARSA